MTKLRATLLGVGDIDTGRRVWHAVMGSRSWTIRPAAPGLITIDYLRRGLNRLSDFYGGLNGWALVPNRELLLSGRAHTGPVATCRHCGVREYFPRAGGAISAQKFFQNKGWELGRSHHMDVCPGTKSPSANMNRNRRQNQRQS